MKLLEKLPKDVVVNFFLTFAIKRFHINKRKLIANDCPLQRWFAWLHNFDPYVYEAGLRWHDYSGLIMVNPKFDWYSGFGK